MSKVEINSFSENGVFKNVDKLIELFTKAENGKALKLNDYNFLTIIGIEKLLTHDDISRITDALTSLEGDVIPNRDVLQADRVIDNLQITLVQPKSDNTKELLDMRWDYRGEKHNSAKEAIDESAARIRSYVNSLYEESQSEQLKDIANIIVGVNTSLAVEYARIANENSNITNEINKLNRYKETKNERLDNIEAHNKEQDFLIKTILDENEKNHARKTEEFITDFSINDANAKKGFLEIYNITGNTLKNLSNIDETYITYNLDDFVNTNEYDCDNENDVLIEVEKIIGRTMFNYNQERDITPRYKYDDVVGNVKDLKNNEPGLMQIESIVGNTMTNLATIKEETIITHQFDGLKGNHNELQDVIEGVVHVNEITGNTMSNLSKSKSEFQVTHSFNNLINDVELNLIGAKNDSSLRVGIAQGKTLENLVIEEPRYMALNNEINETFENSITLNDTVEGGQLDLIIEGHTTLNMSKIKDSTPVTYKYEDIIGNSGELNNSTDGTIEINTIKGNTLINKIIFDQLSEIDTKKSFRLEPHSMYQIIFDLDKDCDSHTIEIGHQVFDHPLTAGQNKFTLYMKDEEFIGSLIFNSDNEAVLSNLKIYKGGQESLVLNDKIDLKDTSNTTIEDTVALGRIDIELMGNSVLNVAKIRDEAIIIDSNGEDIKGNIGEIESNSEHIEIASIKGSTYRNMLNKKVDLTFTGVGYKHNFMLLKEVEPNMECTVVCDASAPFSIIIDEVTYKNIDNGTVFVIPENLNDHTFTVRSEVKGHVINNLMLLEGRVDVDLLESVNAFLGVVSTFETEIENDMYKVEITSSNEDEELSTEVFYLEEPLRSVFEYNDELVYDNATQELVVNRVATQIQGSIMDRNVLYSSQAGIRIKFDNQEITYERLEDAIGRVPGRDFNHMMPWAGMRKVAINTLTGEKTYYNESGYKEDGSVGSIFIEVPKFYYAMNAIETEDYYSNIINNLSERNLINWKISYETGSLVSTTSNYHKTTSYYEYSKSKPLRFNYDTNKFSAEVIYFNSSSSVTYPTYELAPDTGKFRICFKKLDETEFTVDDVLHLIETSRMNEFRGKHINIGEWSVSNTLEAGYVIHPAFIRNGEEVDYIYIAAYESGAYSVKNQSFILDDFNVDVNNDYLVSVSNSYPVTGFGGKIMTLLNNRKCANRANAHLFDLTSLSAIQLLYLIEYGSFDSQSIGRGVVDLEESLTVSNAVKTGLTSSLIDKTGERHAIAYRGIENLWGNTWTMIDGVNIYNDAMTTMYWSNDELDLSTTEGFNKINSSSPNHKGSIRKFGYDKDNPFVFVPSLVDEDNYINENYEQKESSGWRVYLSGGAWSTGDAAGLFSSKQDSGTGTTNLTIGTRLLYY